MASTMVATVADPAAEAEFAVTGAAAPHQVQAGGRPVACR